MATMHDAVSRLTAAHHARRKAHHDTVTSHLSGRVELTPPAGHHAPPGPTFPIQPTGGGDRGADPESH